MSLWWVLVGLAMADPVVKDLIYAVEDRSTRRTTALLDAGLDPDARYTRAVSLLRCRSSRPAC